jgi:hypothetical protein
VPSQQLLSAAEAKRAIYIDFEGNEEHHPTLLGVLSGDDDDDTANLEQVIVEELFWPCAGKKGARECVRGQLDATVTRIVTRANNEDRRIVSWSTHDLRVIATALPSSPALDGLKDAHRNGIPTAQKWIELRETAPKTGDNCLPFYLQRVRYRVPDKYGAGKVGRSLTYLREHLSDPRSSYGTLSPVGRIA